MATLRSIPDVLDWEWYVGDTEPEVFMVTGESPVDLTGAVIEAQVRSAPKDSAVAVQADVVLTDAAAGRFTVGWPADELRALVDAARGDRWAGVWDLQITLADGSIRTRVAGRFIAVYDVTRLV